MRQVFISYSSKDYSQALSVRNVLEQNGITCWMAPESIPGGSNYTKEIPIAIRECQAFVLMLSANAQNPKIRASARMWLFELDEISCVNWNDRHSIASCFLQLCKIIQFIIT